MTRVCPKCGFYLRSFNHYFCSSCGSKLPAEIVIPDDSFVQVSYLREITKVHMGTKNIISNYISRIRNFKAKKIVFLFIFLAFGTLLILAKLGLEKVKVNINMKKASSTLTSIVNSNLNKKDTLGSKAITDYVPYDVDVYIETTDYKSLGDLLLDIDKNYYLLVSRFEELVKPHAG